MSALAPAPTRERHYTYAEASAEFFNGDVSERQLRDAAGLKANHPRRLKVKRYSSSNVKIPQSELERWDKSRMW